MPAQKPSLDLLRQLTDTHVVTALAEAGRLTRAELATATGISKPTVAESIRRLEAAGLVTDTGERSRGRGRSGLYYALGPGTGVALAVGIAPEGISAEAHDVHGTLLARRSVEVARPARPAQVRRALLDVAAGVAAEVAPAPVRLAVVSAADPVDRRTGRLVHLPDAPFLVGELDPVGALARFVDGPVTVDNDVNWSAAAERAAHPGLDDFAYLYLGDGLGGAVVCDGQVRRGAGGLAGEVAHLVVSGPGGRAMAFTEVFAELGLRHEGTEAVDSQRLLERARDHRRASRDLVADVATAVAGVVAAVVALADPAEVVLGGSWGGDPVLLAAVDDRVQSSRRPVPVRASAVTDVPLAGVRGHAVRALRQRVVDVATRADPGDPPD